MAFGFDPSDPTGFNNPTFTQLVLDLQAKYFAETGILVDLDLKSPDLGLIRTMSRSLKGNYDDQAGAYASAFQATSAGVALRNLLFPLIGDPLPDKLSSVLLPVTGTPLTTIGLGSTAKLEDDGPAALAWTLVGDINLDAGGLGSGTFKYANPGPKSSAPGDLWTIGTPLANWSTVGPTATLATEGRIAETDVEYRLRARLSAVGRRLFAAVSAVNGVTAVSIFENQSDVKDSFWSATHWIELLVQGGDDAEIAAAIQGSRCTTVQTLGSILIAVPAEGFAGGTVLIRFSRPNLVEVFVDQTITKGEGYSTDTSAAAVAAREVAIKEQIELIGNSRPVGLDATAFQTATWAASTPSVPGIGDIAAFVGVAPFPADSIVVAEPRDLLVFSVSNITLAGV